MRRNLSNVLSHEALYGRPREFSQVPGPYPPSAPRGGGPPRLPAIPIEPYAPPFSQVAPAPRAPPVNNQTGYSETFLANAALPAPGVAPAFGVEATLYSFRQHWSSCDVYVAVPFDIASPGVLTFRVYSVTQGVRALVASGRVGSTAGLGTTAQRWVCAARGLADLYEVTVENDNAAAAGAEVAVAIIGSNGADEPNDFIGSARVNPTVTDVSEIDTLAPQVQVLGVHASKLVAANVRWLQIHDTSVAIVAGAAPVLSFALPAVLGQPLYLADVGKLFPTSRLVNGIAVGISSTGPTFTIVPDGEVAWMVWFR